MAIKKYFKYLWLYNTTAYLEKLVLVSFQPIHLVIIKLKMAGPIYSAVRQSLQSCLGCPCERFLAIKFLFNRV